MEKMSKALTPEQYREEMARKHKPSNSRFNNVWTEIDGIKFQSATEATYYGRLKLRKQAGDIKGFTRQVLFTLAVNRVLICTYRADFVILHNDNSREVIDVKSESTAKMYHFTLIKNLMLAIHGIKITVAK